MDQAPSPAEAALTEAPQSRRAVHITNLAFRWPGEDGFRLSVPEFHVEAGERVLLLGESGSGKSTLLSLICGVTVPTSGRILINGQDIAQLAAPHRDRFRAENIGLIFQQFNLLPFASALDNVVLPLAFAPTRRARTPTPKAAAAALLAALGLTEPTVHRAAARTLSVGQQQRVAAARALIGDPALIVADEPTSALDAGSENAFMDRLDAQTRAKAASLLMVSHDERLAPRFDRAVRLRDIAQATRDRTV